MTKDEALRLALENINKAHAKVAALCEGSESWTMSVPPRPDSDHDIVITNALLAAETVINEALAQPTPDPVAFLYTLEYGKTVVDKKVSIDQLNYPFGVCGADYQAKNEDGVSYVRQTPLYTTPPQRTWVGLTDEEARVKFESWHKAEYVQPLERYGHTYKNMHVRNRWQGWLAANGIKEKTHD